MNWMQITNRQKFVALSSLVEKVKLNRSQAVNVHNLLTIIQFVLYTNLSTGSNKLVYSRVDVDMPFTT